MNLAPELPGRAVGSPPEQGLNKRLRFTFENPSGGVAGGVATGPFPFDVSFGPGSDGSHSAATIRPGTVNGLVPANILVIADLENSTDYYLVISATVAAGEITGCTIAFTTTAPGAIVPTLGEPPLTWDYVVGMVIDATWFRTIGNGSLFATPEEVFRVSKVAPAPGTLPYDIYYTWSIDSA